MVKTQSKLLKRTWGHMIVHCISGHLNCLINLLLRNVVKWSDKF